MRSAKARRATLKIKITESEGKALLVTRTEKTEDSAPRN
jgi:hypothetical protein